MGEDLLGRFAGDDLGQAFDPGALEVGDAAELAKELSGGGWTDAGDFAQAVLVWRLPRRRRWKVTAKR